MSYASYRFAENTYQRGGYESWVRQIIANLNRLESALELEQTSLWCLQPDPIPRVFCWNTLEGWEVPARIDAVRSAAGLAAFEWPGAFNLYDQSRFMSAGDLNTLSRAVGYPATRQSIDGNAQNYYLMVRPVYSPLPYYSGHTLFRYRLSGTGTFTLSEQRTILTSNNPYTDTGFLPADLHTIDTVTATDTITKLRCAFHGFKDSLGYIRGDNNTTYYIIQNVVHDANERELLLRGLWPDPEEYQALGRGVLSMAGGMTVGQDIAIPQSIVKYQPSGTGFYSNGTIPNPYSADTGESGSLASGNLCGGMLLPYTWINDESVTATAYNPQLAILTSAQVVHSKTFTVTADAICVNYPNEYRISSINSAEADPPALNCRIERSTSDYEDLPGTNGNGARGWVSSYDGSFTSASIGFIPDPAWSAAPQLNVTLPFQLNSFALNRIATPSGIPGVDNVTYGEVNVGQGFQRDIAYAEWEADLPTVWIASTR